MADDPQVTLPEELVAWTKFANRDSLIKLLDQVLKDSQHLLAFELTDGRRQSEFAQGSGLAQPTVSGLWQRWKRLGMVREKDGRVVHLARASDLEMERASSLVSAAEGRASVSPRRGGGGTTQTGSESAQPVSE
jgi:hypothetical protein